MKRFTTSILLTLLTTCLFAQAQMIVWSEGTPTAFPITAVDSITFNLEDESTANGVFSVSDSTTVAFSSGNLQYHPVDNIWRFAPKQTDYIGNANTNIAPTYDGWIDLFGKGTGLNPTCSTNKHADYKATTDWGVNTIGEDAPNTWRSLGYYEWDYLIHYRENADQLIGVAQVNGVNGTILLPDNWTCPEGITFKPGFHDAEYSAANYAAYQSFNADQWAAMEETGAVFLPAAGYRGEKKIIDLQVIGRYWSDSNDPYSDMMAGYITMYSDDAFMMWSFRYYGMSVRLVQDL